MKPIPFQSGDNDVLRAMARGYTVERYQHIIENIRDRIPDAALSADAIVAFPGETDSQFRRTLALIENLGFDQVNTAAYSPRPNTPAATWPNQIEDKVKVERLRELNDIVERTARARNNRYVGRIEEVLVEGVNLRNPAQLMGRTRTNRLTFFSAISLNDKLCKPGELINVHIEEARSFSLSGTVLS